VRGNAGRIPQDADSKAKKKHAKRQKTLNHINGQGGGGQSKTRRGVARQKNLQKQPVVCGGPTGGSDTWRKKVSRRSGGKPSKNKISLGAPPGTKKIPKREVKKGGGKREDTQGPPGLLSEDEN